MQTIHLDIENDRFMKAMTKQQIADCAGVSVRTLLNWCKPYRQELARMGMTPGMRVLPPNIVKWMAERFCIDVPT
jgi:hypothetical protein